MRIFTKAPFSEVNWFDTNITVKEGISRRRLPPIFSKVKDAIYGSGEALECRLINLISYRLDF